ncbi:MAG: peptidylprolyl isomerase [Planctomycetota bacterium]
MLLVSTFAAAQNTPVVKWEPPKSAYMSGSPYTVKISMQAPKEGAETEAWLLDASAFTVNGKPIGERGSGKLKLLPGAKLTLEMDIGPALASASGTNETFKLGFAKGVVESEEITVNTIQGVEKGLDFMKMPVEDLSKYRVVFMTNRGNMEAEFWPDVAPNHVRNFLDLAYTGFYDGKIFHRVIPGFMIQGGDPTGTGTGSGPRMLKAEFNDRKHVAGVLSMARSASPDSASCQFFVMHATSPHLDNQYSAFGKLVSGQDVVDKIVNSPKGAQDRPKEPQVITKMIVIKAPAK